jgi:hypothetical protein
MLGEYAVICDCDVAYRFNNIMGQFGCPACATKFSKLYEYQGWMDCK